MVSMIEEGLTAHAEGDLSSRMLAEKRSHAFMSQVELVSFIGEQDEENLIKHIRCCRRAQSRSV